MNRRSSPRAIGEGQAIASKTQSLLEEGKKEDMFTVQCERKTKRSKMSEQILLKCDERIRSGHRDTRSVEEA